MSGRNCADIVFCIDVSGSMTPCLEGVCEHVGKLIEGLASNGQMNWDVRFDFLVFSDGIDIGDTDYTCPSANIHFYQSVHLNAVEIIRNLYHNGDKGKFFTRDVNKFQQALAKVETFCCEQHPLALDIATDFPWHPSDSCHRVVILLSDQEPNNRDLFTSKRQDALVSKIQRKRIKLFIVAPEDDFYETLGSINRCEYEPCECLNLTPEAIDFNELLRNIGKSVSTSQYVDNGDTRPEPIYGQQNWPLKPVGDEQDHICISEH